VDHSKFEETRLMRGLLPDSDLPSPRFGNLDDLQDESRASMLNDSENKGLLDARTKVPNFFS
jgi:hypothetical protein